MKKQFQEITNFFRVERLRNDRRIVIFLVCLFIATILWFLNAMSKDYATSISYPVKYTNPPENLFLSNDPPRKLNIEVNAHGFTLLRHKLSFSISPIVLNLTTIRNTNETESNTMSVRTESLMRRISGQVSSEISVVNIEPEIIVLIFDSLKTKKVPVTSDIRLRLKPQFFLNGNITLEPDSVQLTGPSSIIDTIHVLQIKSRIFENLDAEVNTPITILHPDKTKVEPKKTNLNIPVERFTEKKINIPVRIRNKPNDVNMKIFPSEVDISFLVALSDYESLTSSDFEVFTVYDSIRNNETLEVFIGNKPDFIQQLRVLPPKVEYLIQTD
ncbi:MAG TPA: CdaR family protein [Prolixibacteraceae bacterium]|nr:CdaR family protein [Prolixibacteraceae bacterium]